MNRIAEIGFSEVCSAPVYQHGAISLRSLQEGLGKWKQPGGAILRQFIPDRGSGWKQIKKKVKKEVEVKR